MAKDMVRAANLLVLATGLMIASCHSAPEGQVVAKVNGEEITQQQLDTAIAQFGAPSGSDRNLVRKAVLQELVEQRLIVAKAKEMGLDKTPEYLVGSQATDDKILAGLWARRLTANVRTPLESEVTEFIRANPGRFDKREVLILNQVRTAGIVLNSDWLPRQTSVAQVIEQLKAHGVPYVLAQTTLDTSDIDPALYQKLVNRDPNRPFAVAAGADAVISTIASRESKPLGAEQARAVAIGIMKRRSAEAAVKNAVTTYRRSAEVTYQAGPAASSTPK